MATKKSADLKASTGKASTAVAVRPNTNIVSIRDQLAKQAAAMTERTAAPSGVKIKVAPGGKFTLPSGQVVQGTLEAVIVDFRTTHAFYAGKYDKNNIQPPVCAAVGSNPKAMIPFKASPDAQCGDCQACPMNQFGSDGDGKACKNSRRLALLPPNEAGDGVDGEAELWTLEVSPTALKGFDGYVRNLASTFALPPVAFLTTIGMDESVDYVKLTFSNPRPLSADDMAAAFARQGEATPLLEAEPDMTPRTAPAKQASTRKVANARR